MRSCRSRRTAGSIVNIGSVSGLRPSPGTAAYGAAKAGLVNLTQTLAVEWAPKVRVNCLSAGLVATEAADDHYGGRRGMAEVAATVPLGRFGTPDDVAGLCLVLASPLAGYVTGANLVAHGGGEWPAFLAAVGADHRGVRARSRSVPARRPARRRSGGRDRRPGPRTVPAGRKPLKWRLRGGRCPMCDQKFVPTGPAMSAR